jgi:ABC-type dipeptide/oligopeptide/nickel transport system permease subunit
VTQIAQYDGFQEKPRSLWSDAWRRLRYSITARIGMAIVAIILLAAIIAPIVDPYNPKLDSDRRGSTLWARTTWDGTFSGASCTAHACR